MSWIDAQGREHKLITAEKSMVVEDPILGFDRQIIAGQPVPPDLEEQYKAELGSTDAAAGGGEGGSSDDDGLDPLNRKELDELAAKEGVDNPQELANKDAVKAAIRAARAGE